MKLFHFSLSSMIKITYVRVLSYASIHDHWSFDPVCTTSDVWKYEVMVLLLLFPDTDNTCIESNDEFHNRPQVLLSTTMTLTNIPPTIVATLGCCSRG